MFNDDDLKHIFAYLRSLKPLKHRVDNTEPLTYCKICGQRDGGGEQLAEHRPNDDEKQIN